MNVNDWKTIQMRNDVKYIKRQLVGNNAAEWSAVFDLFLVLLAFVLDRAFGDCGSPNIALIVIAIAGFVVPSLLFLTEKLKTRRVERLSRRITSTRDLVSMFDDEVCYLIMTAEAFNSNLRRVESTTSRQSALMLQFYVIETTYYLNKAVQLIIKLDNNLISVLDESDISKPHISRTRLVNAISLIASIYDELIPLCQNKNKMLKAYSIRLDESTMLNHYKALKSFVTERKETIGMDLRKNFSIN